MAETKKLNKYSKRFDSNCSFWTKDSKVNELLISRAQFYANENLRIKGYLFLNTVYEWLGMATTKAGQVVGWIYAPGKMIDFGMSREDGTSNYILNFNVDGEILDKTNMEDY